jgi:hypothetical protein
MYLRSPSALIVRTRTGLDVELPVRSDLSDALLSALQAASSELDAARLGDLCAQDLVGLLRVLEEGDKRPPTAAQIKFGLDISRRLGVDLPFGALQDRGVMGRFLTRYADSVRPPTAIATPSTTPAKSEKRKSPLGRYSSTNIPRPRRPKSGDAPVSE